MGEGHDGGLTATLNAGLDGDDAAREQAWAAVYDEVHQMASHAVAHERPATQIQPTMVVHEVFMRLERSHPDQWDSRRHFFGAVARSIQQFLIDQARQRAAKRRGGGRGKLSLTVVAGELASYEATLAVELPGLLAAFDQLEEESPRAAEVARLRYILGLTIDQVAGITGISGRTVKKDWSYARAWLRRALDELD